MRPWTDGSEPVVSSRSGRHVAPLSSSQQKTWRLAQLETFHIYFHDYMEHSQPVSPLPGKSLLHTLSANCNITRAYDIAMGDNELISLQVRN